MMSNDGRAKRLSLQRLLIGACLVARVFQLLFGERSVGLPAHQGQLFSRGRSDGIGDGVAPQLNGLDVAWRLHEALIGWTGKVDSKAGFALSAETAVLAAMVGLIAPGRIFADFRSQWIAALFYIGCTFMIFAVLMAACAVVPRMYSRGGEQQAQINFIYFGNLRFWDPAELARVMNEQDPLPALSRQLVNISRIVWIKHRCVQFSLWFAAAGGVALVATGLFS